MPAESTFKKHAELVRDALKNFMTVKSLNSPSLVKTVVSELIDATIAFNPYIPFFLNHALFQELPPAVFNTLNDFAAENPSFVMPKSFDKVSVLNDRVQGSITHAISSKKSESRFSYVLFFVFLFFFLQVPLSLLRRVLTSKLKK